MDPNGLIRVIRCRFATGSFKNSWIVGTLFVFLLFAHKPTCWINSIRLSDSNNHSLTFQTHTHSGHRSRFSEFSCCVLHVLVVVSGWRLNHTLLHTQMWAESSECPWTSQAESSSIWSLLWASNVWIWFSGNAQRRKSLGKQECACQSVIQPGKMYRDGGKFSGFRANCKTHSKTMILSLGLFWPSYMIEKHKDSFLHFFTLYLWLYLNPISIESRCNCHSVCRLQVMETLLRSLCLTERWLTGGRP